MTNGTHLEAEGERRRSVTLKIVKPDDDTYERDGASSESEPSPKGTPEIMPKPPVISSLTRQVSHDGLASCGDKDNEKKQAASCDVGRVSPIRSVTQVDKVNLSQTTKQDSNMDAASRCIPPQPNPLHSRGLFRRHNISLRLEAALHPMRLILSRLMTNLTYNRKGVFNTPVDPIALNLPDYFSTIAKPMDLGTVKNRLHSLAYKSRQDVADDIRLCFRNAMLYNPPHNAIHLAAKELLIYFEDQLSSFCPEIADFSLLKTDEQQKSLDGEEMDELTTNEELPLQQSMGISDCVSFGRNGSTRNSNHYEQPTSSSHTSTSMKKKKRRKRGSKRNPGHSCQWCNGNICYICEQGCLPLQPSLLICNGPQCIGAKIRKGSTYFTTQDGSAQYCERCYIGLPAVLPGKNDDADVCRYKRNLLKRKNDEDIVEQWLSCVNCECAVHQICAMHNPYVNPSENFLCPSCYNAADDLADIETPHIPSEPLAVDAKFDLYSFVAGEDFPIPLSAIVSTPCDDEFISLRADLLPENAVSRFIEAKVRERMIASDCPNAEKTVLVRTISECERYFKVPDVIRNHFRMQDIKSNAAGVALPVKVMYRSKAIALFQKFDGLDVCIFCMYVQEYNCNDEFESDSDKARAVQEKRVYISYIDSVEHFRPRNIRTAVYQEVLTAYLATARLRGYETAHIWACPPSRGNSFVFWNHPTAQRTPNTERLTAWYHATLGRAMECGVVTDVSSLFESSFEEPLRRIEECTSNIPDSVLEMPCPPLLEGDFWIEEAQRIHNITFSRLVKESGMVLTDSQSTADENKAEHCLALQLAAMFEEKILVHPLSKAFRRPVNAAALKLDDYHKIVTKPMDLGTVHAKCLLGEYETLSDFVADVSLVFSNAKKFNPPGHIVHINAIDLQDIFFTELNSFTESWLDNISSQDGLHSWEVFGQIHLSLYSTRKNNDLRVRSSTSTSQYNTEHSFEKKNHNVLHMEGPEYVRRRMVGNDTWLLEKKAVIPQKSIGTTSGSKRGRKSTVESPEELVSKRRRQTWLGEEVGATVRRMRTSFFKCCLKQNPESNDITERSFSSFRSYIGSFNIDEETTLSSSRVADARHAFLELSQFRNLEFDTLRRAKYSSAVLLYHLHHDGAPGLIPECTTCGKEIEGVRWHRMCKVTESRSTQLISNTGRRPKLLLPYIQEELCSSCFSSHSNQKQFIPIQVSL